MTDLPHILNWRRIDDTVTTSGQPTEDQLAEIKTLGVTHVINLGPHSNDGALPDEPGTVAALGMEYIYIPVDFDAPSEADFDRFCTALDNCKDQPVHVHCIYNARVSAFFYRRAKDGIAGSVDEAFNRMDSIWRPGGVWADFIGAPGATNRRNLYAGDDY